MEAYVLAVIFDFDDTLVPDSTTKLLRAHGFGDAQVDTFWGDAKQLVLAGYDPAPAYLKLLLDNIGKGKPLGELTNKKLREFGSTLDSDFFPGIPEVFDDLRTEVARYKDIKIEFYIISGGLRPIIEGSQTVSKHFDAVYACQLSGDADGGILKYIKRCVTSTEKTRYIFEINKGLDPSDTGHKPYLVNKFVPVRERRVPFRNMIYIGDGLTDVPCFSLVKNGTRGSSGGSTFGIFDPSKMDEAKRSFVEFLKGERVLSLHKPQYQSNDELGSLLRSAVSVRCSEIRLRREEAEGDEEE